MKDNNILFGKKALLDAIENNLPIKYVAVLKPLEQLDVIQKQCKPSFFQQFNHVNHQFIVTYLDCQIEHLTLDELIDNKKNNADVTILILDENEDPRNFGAIIRSAAAFNVDAIVYKNNHQAQINELVIKTSMGAVYQTSFVKVANINQAIEKLKKADYWIYASALNHEAIDLQKTDFSAKCAIIVGNENHGISALTLKKADFVLKIPMDQKVQSLNISVATGIILAWRYIKLLQE